MQGETFIFFGIASSGKGTQMSLLEKYIKEKYKKECLHIGTGDGFRNIINKDNYVSGLVKEYLEKGNLMPDFFATSIVVDFFVSNLTPERNLITDGYPRTLKQAEDFQAMMNFFRRSKIQIIYIELSKEEAMKRNLLRGRSDDNEETIKKRFDWYYSNVIPTINSFEGKSGVTMHKINGEQPIENVHNDIIKSLNI